MKQIKQFDITLMYIVAGVAVMIGIGLLVYTVAPRGFGGGAIISLPTNDTDTEDTCDFRRVLDGVCVDSEAETNPKLVAIMVENHFESWPQSGVVDARVVYEAPVEGNISRFLLLYTEDQDIAKVGPVRSARPYYLDWLAEYGAPQYMHVGGSPDALARISREDVNDLNEFSRGWYYWRDTNRYAPHNVYTSSELWQDALEAYPEHYTTSSYEGWKFADVTSCTDDACVTTIDIPYAAGNTYTATWTYNTTTETYMRSQAGSADIDTDGTQIMANTVIVQYVDSTVLDAVGRLGIDTIGAGRAIVFQKGNILEGEWRKDAVGSRTRWYDGEEEIALTPGKIWVQVINKDTVTYE